MPRSKRKPGRPKEYGLMSLIKFLTSKSLGCKYSVSCLYCKLPACVFDGYDPYYHVPRRRTDKVWTSREKEHFNELSSLELSDQVLANIFRCSVLDIRVRKYELWRKDYMEVLNGSHL